ncbi:hypothetical protein EON65_08045 [archaeon]|nr:MAG: hypothetical protein EON65_08045 [archaeon]
MNTSNPIPEGSSEFTRKFLDIARAGNIMITADQTLQNLHNSDRRVALSSQFSVDMEVLLSKMQSSFTTSAIQNSNTLLPPPITTTTSNISHFMESSDGVKEEGKRSSVQAPLDVNLNMILTKHVSYQSTYTALSPHVLHNSMPSSSVPVAWSAEAELSTEVIACVEKREMVYKQIISVAHEMQTLYLEHGIEAARLKTQQFEDLLQELRTVTLDLAEAYGAWSRVIIKQEAMEKKKGKKKVTKMYTHEPDTRTYCVVIGFKSVHELFPASQAVQLGNKKFCRGYEVAVKGIECKFVGEYKTERDAVEALEDAFRNVPDEQWLEADISAERKSIVGYRPCGKHFIVRSSGVPADIPCEGCGAATASNTDTIAPKLYKFINGFPVFSYSNVNYIEKVWKDMTALENIDVVKKLFPSVETFKNPFYLDSSTRTQLLNTMLLKDNSSDEVSFSRHRKTADPLGNLKGRMEILQDALLYSKTYQAEVEEKNKRKKVSSHPLFKTQHVPKIFEDEVKKLESTSSKTRKSTKTGTITMHTSASTSRLPDIQKPGQTLSLATEIHGIRAERYIAALKVLSQVLGSEYAEKSVRNEDQIEQGQIRTSTTAPYSTTHRDSTTNLNVKTSSSHRGHGFTGIAADDEEDENDMNFADDLNSLPVQAITAVFTDRGADFFLDSTRPLPAYREDDMFCRTDVGEFAHFTKGRSVKQFNYQQETYKQGKIKEKRRKQLQSQLRHAVQQRYTADHINYVHVLIDQAKEIRGSVLQFDIIQAENFVLKYHSMIKHSIMVQSMYRGNKDRMFFYKLREQYVRDQVHRKYTAIFAYNTAQSIMPELVKENMLQHKKDRCRRLYTVVVNMSGFLCVVSIYRGARQLRKPTATLCQSCNTKSATYYANEDVLNMAHSTVNVKKYRDKYHGSKPVPTHLEELRENDDMYKHVYDIKYNDKPWAQRTPCTCKLLEEVENWRVGFYFPLDRKTMHKTYKVEEVVKLLLFIEGVKCMREPSYAYGALVGDSFDYLTPLFGPRPVSAGNQADTLHSKDVYSSASYSKAWLKAAKEASVLPRLVTQLPDSIQNVLTKYQTSSTNNVATEPKACNMLYYLDKYTAPDISGSLNVQQLVTNSYTNHVSSRYQDSDVNAAERLDEEDKKLAFNQCFIDQWQPIWELERIKLVIKRTGIILAEQQQKLTITDKDFSSTVAELEICETTLEQATMTHEDRMSLLQRIQANIYFAERRNKEVMQYSKDLFAFTSNLEQNVEEDWTRSYDKPEEAHLWEFMHRKHQLELMLARELTPIPSEQATIVNASQSVEKVRRLAHKLRAEKILLTTIVRNISKELEYIQKTLAEKHNSMFKTIRLMFHVYSYKRHFVLGRNINIFPINLVFVRQPELRLKPEYREMLNAVHRQVVTLYKHNINTKKVIKLDKTMEIIQPLTLFRSQYSDDDIYIRCLVSLYVDDVSKAFVITVQGNYNHIPNKADAVTTEESCQHMDFGLEKGQYSPMLLLSNTNDIIITRDEVNMLLKRDARHYHIAERVARLRPSTEFKIPSSFDRDVQYAKNVTCKHQYIHLGETEADSVMTYRKRQAALDDGDLNTAKKLLEHIRLNIFSHRVCIGMVHLYRRVVQFDKVFRNCMYYNDLMSHSPVNIQHDLYNNICPNHSMLFHGNTRLLVNFYQYLHKFTVSLHFQSVDSWLPVFINVDMQLETLLKSLLCRGTIPLSYILLLKSFTTLQYSPTFISYVLRSLAITLPGQLSGYYNRNPLAAELPTFFFNVHHITSYKFLISFYRFMLNTYLYIKVYRNHLDDVYIEIYKPNNGKFYFHSYGGNVIKLYVSHIDIRIILLKMLRIELLHPDSVMDLINYLLDGFVYIDFKEVASGYVQSVETAQSRPQSRYLSQENPVAQRGAQCGVPLSIADASYSPVEEMFLHLYDHYIRSTTPLPMPSPSPLLPAMNSRFIVVNSLPGLSRSESLIVDVHALKFYLCHTLDMFNSWKKTRFENFAKVPTISPDTIQQLLKQVNTFTSYPLYVLHPTTKTSQGNLQMINVFTSIYPFKLMDTQETAEQATSTHLFTTVFLSDDKGFVKVEISNLNHRVHGKEIEDMSLMYDREAFHEEDMRSRKVIEYYLYKQKVIDYRASLVDSQLRSLKRFKMYIDDVINRRLRDLSYEMLQCLTSNANRLLAKNISVNLLFLLLPNSRDLAKSVELQRDVRMVSNGPKRFASSVQDAMYALFAASGLKQQVLFSHLDLDQMDMLVVYTDSCYNRLASRQHHARSLMQSSVRSYQSLGEYKEKAYFYMRHPDLWSKPTVKKDRKKSRICGLHVYEDRHSRMVCLDHQDYMLKNITVSNYGVLTLQMYHLDSSKDLLVHAFAKSVNQNGKDPNKEVDFASKLSSAIDAYAKETTGDVLQAQIHQIGLLTQRVVKSVAQSLVHGIVGTCAALLAQTQLVLPSTDEVITVLKRRLLPYQSTRVSRVNNSLHHRLLNKDERFARANLHSRPRNAFLFHAPKYKDIMSEKEYNELVSLSDEPAPLPLVAAKQSRRRSTVRQNRRQSFRGSKSLAIGGISEASADGKISQAIEEAVHTVSLGSYCALFVPLDQGIEVTPVYIRPWEDAVASVLETYLMVDVQDYINCRIKELSRVTLTHAIAYYITWPTSNKPSDRQRNERYYRLQEHLQVKKEVQEGEFNSGDLLDTICNGDVLLLFRHNKDNIFQKTLSLCHEYMQQYLPILALRREREGREHEYRVNVYTSYKQIITKLAERLEPQMNAIFNPLSYIKVEGVDKNLQHIILQLLRWFDVSKSKLNGSVYEVDGDVYFLGDSYLFQQQPALFLMFDAALSENSCNFQGPILHHPYISKMYRTLMNRDFASDAEDKDAVPSYFSPAQVLYAVYQQHCYHCSLPYSVCRFPGCSHVRSMSRAALGGDLWLSQHDHSSSPELTKYCGKYPLDVEIKRFIFSHKLLDMTQYLDYLIKQFYTNYHEGYNYQTVDKECQLENKIDAQAYYDYHYQHFLSCRYEDLNIELHYLDILQRILLLPETVAMKHSASECLLAEGGINYERKVNEIKDLIEQVRNKQQQKALRHLLHSLDIRIQTGYQGGQHMCSLSDQPETVNIQTGMISVRMIQRIAGSISADPYPSGEVSRAGSKGPMSEELYQLLMQRVVIIVKPSQAESDLSHVLHRSLRQHGGKDYQAIGKVLAPTKSTTAFKRLLQEEVVILSSQELLVVQILYGVMTHQELLISQDRGVPTASLAYIPTDKFEERIKPGLTVSVYDVHSRVTRAVYLNHSQIQQLVGIFNTFFTQYRSSANSSTQNLNASRNSMRAARSFVLPPHLNIYSKQPSFPSPLNANDYLHAGMLIAFYAAYLLKIQRVGNFCTGVELNMFALDSLFNKKMQVDDKGVGSKVKVSLNGNVNYFQPLGKGSFKVQKISHDIEGLLGLANEIQMIKEVL